MIDFLKEYKVEALTVVAILFVMFGPYFIISTSVFGFVKSESRLQEIEMILQRLTPVFIGLLCAFLVYKAIKRNKEITK